MLPVRRAIPATLYNTEPRRKIHGVGQVATCSRLGTRPRGVEEHSPEPSNHRELRDGNQNPASPRQARPVSHEGYRYCGRHTHMELEYAERNLRAARAVIERLCAREHRLESLLRRAANVLSSLPSEERLTTEILAFVRKA